MLKTNETKDKTDGTVDTIAHSTHTQPPTHPHTHRVHADINRHRFRNFTEMRISTTYTEAICLLFIGGLDGDGVASAIRRRSTFSQGTAMTSAANVHILLELHAKSN